MDTNQRHPYRQSSTPPERPDYSLTHKYEFSPNELHHLQEVHQQMTRSMMERQEGYLIIAVLEGYDFMDVFDPQDEPMGPPPEGNSRLRFRREMRMFNEGEEPTYLAGRAPQRYDLRGVEWDELKANIRGYHP